MSAAVAGGESRERVTPPPVPAGDFTPAQQARREALLHDSVRQFRVAEHPGTVQLLDAMRGGSFQGRQLGEAAALFERQSHADLGIIWSLAGSLMLSLIHISEPTRPY